ncbi:glycerophosphodiester phosphodiesterase [Serpentinicella sp. ANB-PHB4]|uniref:glycerophosphodiester phosphodiesterase n=1 Tax=Serpentinicella sp. ANB-PHB4 TaxID=3074076 RepID=UPI00285E5C4D|nr:glycerophosphodiester phosphodiesterase [Serpentinicella sp. ANB-PHB4]MDR5658356.1 glycerophosphodiester phosphodiesterase [Serpentinicella sp. ANB-PHB4]
MLKLLINSLKDFKNTYKKLLLFGFIYMGLTSFIFVPIIAYILNLGIRATGAESLLDYQVLNIVLSYQGLVALMSIIILSTILIFIEFAVVIVIAQKKYFNNNILLADAFVTSIRKIPKLFGIGIFQLMVLLLLLLPIIDWATVSSTLIDNIRIPVFIQEQITASYLFQSLYILLLVCIGYIIVRWIFTLHEIIIEGKSTRKAIKGSMALTRKNGIKIVLKLVSFNVIISLLVIGTIAIITAIPSWLNITDERFYINTLLITFSGALAFIMTLLMTPINLLFLTRLYYAMKSSNNEDIVDNLKPFRSKLLRKWEIKIARLFKYRKIVSGSIIVGVLLTVLFMNYIVTDQVIHYGRDVKIASHRGELHHAPENSLSAIRLAIEKGVDYVEIDVQQTKDGVVVLNHDATLRRVAGVPYSVSELTYEEVAQVDIGSSFSPEYKGEKIPTLEQALMEVKGRSGIIIDIKIFDANVDIAESIVHLIKKHDMVDEVYVQSFNYPVLQAIREKNKDIRIGQIFFFSIGDLLSFDVDFYTVEQSRLSNQLINNAHKAGREVWVWTVNQEQDIKRVLHYNIDGIITDYPERVQRVISLTNN